MKNSITLAFIFSLTGFVSIFGNTNTINRTTIHSRTLTTWEGKYSFSEESIIRIDGLKNLHIIKYNRIKGGSTLIEFATGNGKEKLDIILGADTHIKGVFPILESIDAIPDAKGADIIIRWRHPGNGSFRRVDKYRYTGSSIILINRAEYIRLRGKMQWISEKRLSYIAEEVQNQNPPVREVTKSTLR